MRDSCLPRGGRETSKGLGAEGNGAGAGSPNPAFPLGAIVPEGGAAGGCIGLSAG